MASTSKPIGLRSGSSSRNAWTLSECFSRIQLLTWQLISSWLLSQYLWYVNREYINASYLLIDVDIWSSNALETQICCLRCHPRWSAVRSHWFPRGQHLNLLTSVTEQSPAGSREWSFSSRSWFPHVSTNIPHPPDWSSRLTLSVLANARVAGLLATDDIGVVSLLLFWGMLELGVGMIAICLPTLRPLFRDWSPESIMRSIRSALSLHSIHSGGGSPGRSTGRSAKEVQQLGSESSIVGINMENITNGRASTEGTSTQAYRFQEGRSWTESHGEGDFRVNQEIHHGHQEV